MQNRIRTDKKTDNVWTKQNRRNDGSKQFFLIFSYAVLLLLFQEF